ncbi:E2F-associated phosphoprotein-like [Rhopilema esculentum]|uniref:E2F-associated phosphoprotein-like n=1 Tax=Rhopilema esculentum TaxID=499914 RepID=UPI0031D87C52
MDLFSDDCSRDQDYYVEDESGDEQRNWSSGDEVEVNHELEDSTESFENELNKLKENVERRRSFGMDNDFNMDDEMYNGVADAAESNRLGNNGKQPNNDDLLYDPDMDDDDAKWMERERQKHIPKIPHKSRELKEGETASDKTKGNVRKSDAILSCPACLVTVCIDCQRHDIYKTQYRAMFVLHCNVCRDELLRYENKRKNARKRKDGPGKLIPATEDSKSSEVYNPVKCTECGTVLAVYDCDEIYHFFNVLASQA